MTNSSLKHKDQVFFGVVYASILIKIYLFLCIVVNVTCMISHFQDGGSLKLNPLVKTGRLKI